jgi:hypothetical protein
MRFSLLERTALFIVATGTGEHIEGLALIVETQAFLLVNTQNA